MTDVSTPLWRWSCEFYAVSGVAQSLLALQDEDALDVAIILACLWGEKEKISPDTQQLAKLFAWSAQWAKNVTVPLRCSRRSTKRVLALSDRKDNVTIKGAGDVAALYARLKQCELDAERIQLDTMYSLLRKQSASNDETLMPASDMIKAYCKFAQVPFNDPLTIRYEELRQRSISTFK